MRFAGDKRGAVSVIAALAAVLILSCGALAVDLGSVFLATRRLQGMADLAALAAARDLANYQAAAEGTVAANGWREPVETQVTLGHWREDASLAPGDRFQAGGSPTDAVQVGLTSQTSLYFGAPITGADKTTVIRKATAARADLASFSIGSRLAALDGGVANALLSGLMGSSVSLTVADYNALAGAQVDLLSYTRTLQTKLSLTGASFDKTLDANVQTSAALQALATALGPSTAQTAAVKLAAAASGVGSLKLNSVFDLGPYGRQDHVAGVGRTAINVSALDLIDALLTTAGGARQVKLNFVAAPAGLANVTAFLAIGERPQNSPWLTVTDKDQVVIRTAQARLYLDATVGTGSQSGLLGSLVDVPLYLEVAPAEAKLASLSCPVGGGAGSASLLVRPGIAKLAIASLDPSRLNDFSQTTALSPATLVNLALIKVTGQASADVGGLTWKTAAFSAADIAAGTVKTVDTDDIAQATVSSLLGGLKLNVSVLGLGLNVSGVSQAVGQVLTPAAAPLDSVINSLTGLLGLRLGEADVRMNGLRCGQAALVA